MSRFARPQSQAAISATRLMLEMLAEKAESGADPDAYVIGHADPMRALRDYVVNTVLDGGGESSAVERVLQWALDQVDWDALSAHDPWQAVAVLERREREEAARA
jgi:hypothetical protein